MHFLKTTATVRIMLLTSQELRVFSWQQDTLSPTGKFSADEQGLAEFSRYLDASHDIPVYLVADLIEEDFRLEPVAHVFGNDRKVLLERKLVQFFRTTEYRSARIQDRETGGRRDDNVLFSALTNSEQLSFWVDCLLAKKVRIKGILSVPLLMELFTGFLHLDQIPHLLLVNLEQHSGLRQTYLQAKRLKFSRLLSLLTVTAEGLAEVLPAECTHTRQYLERLKLLPRDQPLDIHIHVPDGTGEVLGRNLRDSALMHYHVHENGMIAAGLGIDPALTGDYGSVFLCLMQALRARRLFNAYGPGPAIRYHRLHQIRQGLIGSTFLLAVIALFAGIFLLNQGLDTRTARFFQEQRAMVFKRQYEKLRRDFPETPVPAKTMQNIVESVERIQQQAVSPMQMMALVSQAMALHPRIHLQLFDWQLSTQEETANISSAGIMPESPGGQKNGQAVVPAILPRLLAGKTGVAATLKGIVYPSTGYGEAQHSVTGFIASLERIPGLKVVPVSMPTATNPDASIKTTLDGGDIMAKFSLRLEYKQTPP
jgi:hypothetical protein